MEKSSCKIFLSCSKLCLVPLEPVYIYIFARKKILKLILKNQQDRLLQFYNSQIKNCQKKIHTFILLTFSLYNLWKKLNKFHICNNLAIQMAKMIKVSILLHRVGTFIREEF